MSGRTTVYLQSPSSASEPACYICFELDRSSRLTGCIGVTISPSGCTGGRDLLNATPLRVVNMTTDSWAAIKELAEQIVSRRPVFFVGSGLSFNCGYPSADGLAERILRELRLSKNDDRLEKDVRRYGLPYVVQYALSDARRDYRWIFTACFGPDRAPEQRRPWLTFKEAVNLYSLSYLGIPTGVPQLVLARLAREGLISEVITTNYDCALELACWSVGMDAIPSQPDEPICDVSACRQGFTVLNSKSYWNSPRFPSVLSIVKMHGGIEDVLNEYTEEKSWLADGGLVLAWEDLVSWSKSAWCRSLFYDRACSSLMVVCGFSAADPYLFGSFMQALTMRNSGLEDSKGSARCPGAAASNLAAIDPSPNVYLQTLAKLGIGHTTDEDGCPRAMVISQTPCGLESQCTDMATCAHWFDILDDSVSQEAEARDSRRKSAIMAGLFTDVYVAVMIRLIDSYLSTTGLSSYIDLFGCGEQAVVHARRAAQEIRCFLKKMDDNSRKYPGGFSRSQLFMKFLPQALVNSWVVSLPPESIAELDRWKCRKDFYVPFLANMKIVYVMLLFVAKLFDLAGKHQLGLVFHSDGSLELLAPHGSPICRRIVPVFTERLSEARSDGKKARDGLDVGVVGSLVRSRSFGLDRAVPQPTVLVLIGTRGTRVEDHSEVILDLKEVLHISSPNDLLRRLTQGIVKRATA